MNLSSVNRFFPLSSWRCAAMGVAAAGLGGLLLPHAAAREFSPSELREAPEWRQDLSELGGCLESLTVTLPSTVHSSVADVALDGNYPGWVPEAFLSGLMILGGGLLVARRWREE